MSMPFCMFSLGLAQEACVKCSLVWWMWRVLMHGQLRSSWNSCWCFEHRTAFWWATEMVTFAVDGACNLVRGASAWQVFDVPAIDNNLFALIGTWLVPMTRMGETCHALQRKLGHALEAAGPTHADDMGAVDRPPALYNGAQQWKEVQKCMQDHVLHKRSGLLLIPANHRIRWSRAKARRNTLFFWPMSPGWQGI